MEEQINPSPIKILLARAIELDRAILTLNRLDFKRLHLQTPNHAGIIICTEDPDRIGQAQRITESLGKVSDVRGQLIRVYRPVCDLKQWLTIAGTPRIVQEWGRKPAAQ